MSFLMRILFCALVFAHSAFAMDKEEAPESAPTSARLRTLSVRFPFPSLHQHLGLGRDFEFPVVKNIVGEIGNKLNFFLINAELFLCPRVYDECWELFIAINLKQPYIPSETALDFAYDDSAEIKRYIDAIASREDLDATTRRRVKDAIEKFFMVVYKGKSGDVIYQKLSTGIAVYYAQTVFNRYYDSFVDRKASYREWKEALRAFFATEIKSRNFKMCVGVFGGQMAAATLKSTLSIALKSSNYSGSSPANFVEEMYEMLSELVHDDAFKTYDPKWNEEAIAKILDEEPDWLVRSTVIAKNHEIQREKEASAQRIGDELIASEAEVKAKGKSKKKPIKKKPKGKKAKRTGARGKSEGERAGNLKQKKKKKNRRTVVKAQKAALASTISYDAQADEESEEKIAEPPKSISHDVLSDRAMLNQCAKPSILATFRQKSQKGLRASAAMAYLHDVDEDRNMGEPVIRAESAMNRPAKRNSYRLSRQASLRDLVKVDAPADKKEVSSKLERLRHMNRAEFNDNFDNCWRTKHKKHDHGAGSSTLGKELATRFSFADGENKLIKEIARLILHANPDSDHGRVFWSWSLKSNLLHPDNYKRVAIDVPNLKHLVDALEARNVTISAQLREALETVFWETSDVIAGETRSYVYRGIVLIIGWEDDPRQPAVVSIYPKGDTALPREMQI